LAELMRRLGALAMLLLLAAGAGAATHNVSVGNFFFSPNDITVAPGDTVIWTFGSTHTVTSTSGESYDSGIQSSGTFSHTFSTVGNHGYVCGLHGAMTGVVRVVAPSPTPTSSPTPTDSPSYTESPTVTVSPSITETPNPSDTRTATPTVSPSFTASPSFSVTPTPTLTLLVSATVSPTPGSFAGIQDARLLASPISGGLLRLWARMLGVPEAVELRAYSSAYTEVLRTSLPPGTGDLRWTVDASSLPPGPLWLQLWVRQRGDWRRGPVLRTYVIR
jgi:plastocyanin